MFEFGYRYIDLGTVDTGIFSPTGERVTVGNFTAHDILIAVRRGF